MSNELENNVMSWDDEIENDSGEYLLMPEGDYNFKVTNFERGEFPGSAKMAASPKAILEMEVDCNGKKAFCKDDLILNKVMEWKMAAFFRSIGQKEHGKAFKPNWSKVLGAEGRAHFKPTTYKDKDYNSVDKYLDYKESEHPTAWVNGLKDAKDIQEMPTVGEDW